MAIDDNTSYELTGAQVKDLASRINAKADTSDIPTVNNGTLTVTQGGTTLGTFTANQSGNSTVDIPAGGETVTYYIANGASSSSSLTGSKNVYSDSARTVQATAEAVYADFQAGKNVLFEYKAGTAAANSKTTIYSLSSMTKYAKASSGDIYDYSGALLSCAEYYDYNYRTATIGFNVVGNEPRAWTFNRVNNILPGDGLITITQNGSTLGSFSTNQNYNDTIDIPSGGGGGGGTVHQIYINGSNFTVFDEKYQLFTSSGLNMPYEGFSFSSYPDSSSVSIVDLVLWASRNEKIVIITAPDSYDAGRYREMELKVVSHYIQSPPVSSETQPNEIMDFEAYFEVTGPAYGGGTSQYGDSSFQMPGISYTVRITRNESGFGDGYYFDATVLMSDELVFTTQYTSNAAFAWAWLSSNPTAYQGVPIPNSHTTQLLDSQSPDRAPQFWDIQYNAINALKIVKAVLSGKKISIFVIAPDAQGGYVPILTKMTFDRFFIGDMNGQQTVQYENISELIEKLARYQATIFLYGTGSGNSSVAMKLWGDIQVNGS